MAGQPQRRWSRRPKWLALADTQEQFQQHWRIGNDPVSYSFDATNKIIDSNGSGNLAGLSCPRKWKEFYCEISVPYVPAGKFDLTLNHESSASPASPQSITFELGDVLGKVPVTASLRVKLDDDYGNFVVLLNGVRVRQAASLDGPEWMNSFNCTFSSGNGGNAKLEMKNIHLLGLWQRPRASLELDAARAQGTIGARAVGASRRAQARRSRGVCLERPGPCQHESFRCSWFNRSETIRRPMGLLCVSR